MQLRTRCMQYPSPDALVMLLSMMPQHPCQLSRTVIHPPVWRILATSLGPHALILQPARAQRLNKSLRKLVSKPVALAGCLRLRLTPPQTRGGGLTAIRSWALAVNTVSSPIPAASRVARHTCRFEVIFRFFTCIRWSRSPAYPAANTSLDFSGR